LKQNFMKKQTKAVPADLLRVFNPSEVDDLLIDLHALAEQAKTYRPKKKRAKRKAR